MSISRYLYLPQVLLFLDLFSELLPVNIKNSIKGNDIFAHLQQMLQFSKEVLRIFLGENRRISDSFRPRSYGRWPYRYKPSVFFGRSSWQSNLPERLFTIRCIRGTVGLQFVINSLLLYLKYLGYTK